MEIFILLLCFYVCSLFDTKLKFIQIFILSFIFGGNTGARIALRRFISESNQILFCCKVRYLMS